MEKHTTRQKPPDPRGKLSGFPYHDCWEEFGPPEKPLYDHGIDRAVIDHAFAKARSLAPNEFRLTKATVFRALSQLELDPLEIRSLAKRLFCFAGHYYSPRFHKLFRDDPATSRRKFRSVAATAAKLDRLVSELTPSIQRHVDVARWSLRSERKSSPEIDWPTRRDYIFELARSSQDVADDFPQFGRGSTQRVLLGRWLRQSAAAIEEATGPEIITKTSDTAGKNFRFEGLEGAAFEGYCKAVDPSVPLETMVMAVRAYQKHKISGRPPKSQNLSI